MPMKYKRHERMQTNEYEINHRSIRHEFDAFGNHRLSTTDVFGPWAAYNAIAFLGIGKYRYAATTDYFEDKLPRVFAIETAMRK